MIAPSVVDAAIPTMMVLRGSPALSAFRLEKLRQSLTQSQPSIRAVDCAFVHFIHVTRELDARESAVLRQLLTYGGESMPGTEGDVFLVIPRIGTISPWASKATDIARNCGLDGVHRIERGVLFSVRGEGGLPAQARAAVVAAIHDPMTETVRFSLADAAGLFVVQTPPPLTHVPVAAEGRQALSRANTGMGLALAADEIDYLFDYYQRIARDPPMSN